VPFLRLERIDETCVAWMEGPRANAIGPAAVREFDLLLAAMRTDPSARSIVIASAHPRAFSSGFDIGEVFAFDREIMRAFFTDFVRLLAAIRRYPKPIVAAIAQPAVAAGGLLAIACDARVFAPAGATLSIKAADLGVVLPRPLVEMVTAAAGPAWSRRLLAGAETIQPQQALDCGLAHALSPNPLADARALALHSASKPPLAFAGWKEMLARDADASAAEIEVFLDQWFGVESTDARSRLMQRLQG
jgi:3,2-trans-enoyl-CoA isomerase